MPAMMRHNFRADGEVCSADTTLSIFASALLSCPLLSTSKLHFVLQHLKFASVLPFLGQNLNHFTGGSCKLQSPTFFLGFSDKAHIATCCFGI